MLGDLAYLQYTSGSTSTPKGVELTHGNLLANLELMAVAFELSERDSAVLWLPPFHDMGLIGGLLQPLYSGFPVTLLSPVHFLEQPIRWLRALSETGATIAGGPDFAYDLCVERIPPEERAALDLSRWEIAFTGSEPVRAETLERFAATFASSGFRSEAFYPCYGLAEASLFVSGGDRSRPPTVCGADPDALAVGRLREPSDGTARRLVSCGRTRPGTTVEIVDPESRVPASPGSVGEVWVRGPSVARGYRGQPEATAATFGARTASGSREEPFLRTGDLGAIVDGELYIVGRLKDLVILQGRNLYPHDVEATASRAHPELARHPSAAFALEIGGRETLAVVHEVGRGLGAHLADRIAATIADAVASEHGARPATVVLTRPGGVPRTTSGKVRRRACRERLVAGHLPTVASLRAAAPAFVHDATTDLESRTRVFLAARLGVTPEAVDLGLPADAAGLDSIAATELAHFLESSTGRSVPLERFFAGETLRELLRELEFGRFSEPPPGNHSPGRDASRADLEGPLSVAQEALWMLHRVEPARTDYHLARAFQVPTSVDHAVLEQALRLLSERHPSLRARFEERQGELRAFLSSPEPLRLLDLPGDDEEAWRCHLEEEAYRPFDLASGPLFRATLHRARAATFLTLAAHHAVADLWSLAVVLDELPRAYEAAHEGKERLDGLPPVLDSPFDFARRQRALLRDRSREALDSHWREQLEGAADPGPLPFEPGTEGRRSGRGAAVRLHLGVGLSRDLEALAKREGVTLFVLLLAIGTWLWGFLSRGAPEPRSPAPWRTASIPSSCRARCPRRPPSSPISPTRASGSSRPSPTPRCRSRSSCAVSHRTGGSTTSRSSGSPSPCSPPRAGPAPPAWPSTSTASGSCTRP
jgi:acyl-CoA synthetase (AMP-forming)/AMP-acid ligase II/acyl carrier protein